MCSLYEVYPVMCLSETFHIQLQLVFGNKEPCMVYFNCCTINLLHVAWVMLGVWDLEGDGAHLSKGWFAFLFLMISVISAPIGVGSDTMRSMQRSTAGSLSLAW